MLSLSTPSLSSLVLLSLSNFLTYIVFHGLSTFILLPPLFDIFTLQFPFSYSYTLYPTIYFWCHSSFYIIKALHTRSTLCLLPNCHPSFFSISHILSFYSLLTSFLSLNSQHLFHLPLKISPAILTSTFYFYLAYKSIMICSFKHRGNLILSFLNSFVNTHLTCTSNLINTTRQLIFSTCF